MPADSVDGIEIDHGCAINRRDDGRNIAAGNSAAGDQFANKAVLAFEAGGVQGLRLGNGEFSAGNQGSGDTGEGDGFGGVLMSGM